MKTYSELDQKQIAARASDKIEAKLFYAFKRLEELELMYEGIIPALVEQEQVVRDIAAQKREVDTLMFMAAQVQEALYDLHKLNHKPETII